ncbi:universal stress protein [Dactylosporangium sp. NBC_01737]|uniref:universal stress protein n=1 Tax=Dactylosporangium sp. NBC_01737 TaxID=2975959 RepID=UPI002E13773D|nr:universal stress protein [Dactylosporangium sp. NBC_01737]
MSNSDLIVVGVDGSEGGRHALRWAVAEGRRTGAAVEAVTAWSWDGIEAAMLAATSPRIEREQAERVSQHELDLVLAGAGSSSPVAREVVEGHPVKVLLDAARRASLLVLGSHGHGRLRHAVLGSISEECVRHATCPVVVIPLPRHDTETPNAVAVPAGR